ncbi:MAG: hypothetical protein VXX28_08225 [Verrucomicrobiota bacterium]|nr:hypothetical protein [Verrucomicrobiota bacterium]MEC8779007.1 hypothetical protein [Verrucomicrobiota bacterium]
MNAHFPLFLSFLALVFCSCRKFEQEKVVARAEPFAPTNLYPVERLPSYFNRVVVLPCYHADPDTPLLDYVDDVFHQELAQERIFETIRFSTADMRRLFGSSRVSSSSDLPENFLRTLDEQTGANGVLFVDLDSYRPYRPMSLGVRAKLVDLKSGEFMWAIDETFDAGHAGVILGASVFQEKAQVRALSAKTSGSVLHSHRVFSKYVASTTFSTLPMR